MLDVNFIRENKEEVKRKVATKNFDAKLIDKVLELDEKRRKILTEIEGLRAERNKVASEKNIEKGKEIKEKLQKLEPELKELEEKYVKILWTIPNLYSDDTPIGKDENENKEIRKWGEPRKFEFEVKDHVEIGKNLGIIDIETASKVVGARFNYLKGDAVFLQNALYQFVISVLTDSEKLKEIADKIQKGYSRKTFIPVVPPLFINPDVYRRMARLSDTTEIERYHMERDDQYLIGSAEHTLGPMHMDEILDEKNLPLRYFAFTAAFRREAGSYGKDTRGIIRQHQFDKIEMESFTTAENGLNEQNFFVAIEEHLMQALEIPYRVIICSTGDMGDPDFRHIDIEAWIPSQDKYRETHSSDYMADYQARRLGTKVRTKNGNEFVHMNDATAFAIGRTIVAILENYQNEDGSVTIPKVLQKWMGKVKIIQS